MDIRLQLEKRLSIDKNFDIVKRQLKDSFFFYFVDGMIKDEIMERIMEYILSEDLNVQTVKQLADYFIPYVEVETTRNIDQVLTAVLSGTLVLCLDNYNEVILIDARTYPTRSMSEPEDDKVLRGSRDGFVETLIFNTALIRRRIRDEHLRMEYINVGKASKSDVVVCYMENIVEKDLVDVIRHKLSTIETKSLTMAQESLSEALVKHKWLNPFPKVRYSERPDTAASNILEGKIVLIIDNSPSILILPTTLFDFIQEAQDYYLPPVTGMYLRLVRISVMLLTMLVTPIWLYLNYHPGLVPDFLKFTLLSDTMSLSFLVQFLLLEFGIDALKLASLNTPSSLNASFSIIGALILGDYAVNAGWFAPEIILYMAFVALANFSQPSYEMGYAVKFTRVFLLLCIGIFPDYGLWIGLIVLGIVLLRTKTIMHTSYLYPLYPFNYKDLKKVFVREKLKDYS